MTMPTSSLMQYLDSRFLTIFPEQRFAMSLTLEQSLRICGMRRKRTRAQCKNGPPRESLLKLSTFLFTRRVIFNGEAMVDVATKLTRRHSSEGRKLGTTATFRSDKMTDEEAWSQLIHLLGKARLA